MVHAYTHTLSVGQPPVVTKSVRSFFAGADMLWHAELDMPVMGAVSGASGTSKSTATSIYQSWVKQEVQAPSFVCHTAVVPPLLTTKGALDTLTQQVSDNDMPSRTLREAFQRSVRAIEAQQVRLLILDQADRLTEEHLSAFLLVGLQSLSARIAFNPSLADAIVRRIFLPLMQEEALQDILPHLVIAGWTFDPADPSAQECDKELWRCTSPSFRRLRTILNWDSHLAQICGEATITRQRIEDAFHMMDLPSNSSTGVSHMEAEER